MIASQRNKMSVHLNEYCLQTIFDHLTPREWIVISQVCTFWKEAVKRQWKKKGFYIRFQDADVQCVDIADNETVESETLSAKDVRKLVLFAAPFAERLFYSENSTNTIRIGSFEYESNMDRNYCRETFELFARKTSKLTFVHLDQTPSEDALNILFSRNKIKNVVAKHSFFSCLPSVGVEEMILNYDSYSTKTIVSFEGHFPKMKKIKMNEDSRHNGTIERWLLKSLPYVSELKSLIISSGAHTLNFNTFDEVTVPPHLEELKFIFWHGHTKVLDDLLIRKFAIGCPQLRTVHFDCLVLNNSTLEKLMHLPQLESLFFTISSDFYLSEIPEMPHLVEFHFLFSGKFYNVPSNYLCNFGTIVEKAPKLQRFQIGNAITFKRRDELIIANVIAGAATQNKSVVLSVRRDGFKKNKFRKVRIHNGESQSVIELSFMCWQGCFDDFFREVNNLLKTSVHLRDYHIYAIVFEDDI